MTDEKIDQALLSEKLKASAFLVTIYGSNVKLFKMFWVLFIFSVYGINTVF